MNTDTWLDELVRKHVLTAFPQFQPAPVSLGFDDELLVGLIGFYGSDLHGTLCVAAREASLSRCAPTIDDPASLDLADWVAELTNHALGRFKAALAQHDVELHSSTPVVLRGVKLQVARERHVRTFAVQRQHDVIHLWIDFAPTTSVPPRPVSRSIEGALGTGDAILLV